MTHPALHTFLSNQIHNRMRMSHPLLPPATKNWAN